MREYILDVRNWTVLLAQRSYTNAHKTHYPCINICWLDNYTNTTIRHRLNPWTPSSIFFNHLRILNLAFTMFSPDTCSFISWERMSTWISENKGPQPYIHPNFPKSWSLLDALMIEFVNDSFSRSSYASVSSPNCPFITTINSPHINCLCLNLLDFQSIVPMPFDGLPILSNSPNDPSSPTFRTLVSVIKVSTPNLSNHCGLPWKTR